MIPWVREQIAEAWHSRKSSRTSERGSLALSTPGSDSKSDIPMFMAPSTSSDTFNVNVISLEGEILQIPSKPWYTIDKLKLLATRHFYGVEHTHSPSTLRLVRPRDSKPLLDSKQLLEEEIKPSDELLLTLIRPPPSEDHPEELLKGPSLEAINKATSHLPPPAPPRPSPSTDCPADFQTEIRKILITLVQASAKILSQSPEAPKLSEIIREKLQQRSQPPNDPKTVKYLTDIGFPEGQVLKALKIKKMNTSEALDWLIDHQDEEDDEEEDLGLPAPVENPPEGSHEPSGSGPSTERRKSFKSGFSDFFKIKTPEGSRENLVTLVSVLLQSFRQYKRLEFRPSSRIKESLVEMGFEEKKVVETLKITGNNQNSACEWLLGARRRSLQDLDEGLDETGPIYQAIMMNPHIQLSLTNPKMMMAYLSILETPSSTSIWINDPEVSPVLSQIFKTYHSEKHVIHMNRYENS
ncbi:ubiquitin-associated domain-containing protein 1 [Fopius arisanus]|uniref:Ubiquitin-associated domain-containing protein 1 n=1 Tax=Fopius arisanus TaxID=64838 RepID=A0A9R1TZ95_9HYME|nr:PREDICTED: ubiquitin-associated domain-containing protein 1 [Fopius arisanus]